MLGIVIPAYKRRNCLREALQSLTYQTFKRFFVIVVDDHSPERLEDVVMEFEDKLHIKYVYAEENGGPGAARQIGLNICYKSDLDLVMFMDSDDMLYPNAVARLTYEINHTKSDIVSASIWAEDSSGVGNKISGDNKTWLHGKIYRTKYLKDNDICFPPMRTNEDLAFNLMAIENTKNKFILDETLYLFRHEPGSITREGSRTASVISIDYVTGIYYAAKYLNERKGITPQIIIDIIACYNHYEIGTELVKEIPDTIKEQMRYLLSLKEVKDFLSHRTNIYEISKIIQAGFVYQKQVYYFKRTFKEWLEEFENACSGN